MIKAAGAHKSDINQKCFFLLLFLLAGRLYGLEGIFVGLGGEANANSIDGLSAGGVLSLDVDINRHFSVGFKKIISFDLEKINTLEDVGFLRWRPFEKAGLFVQAELGASIFFNEGKSYPAFLAAVAAGWQ